VRRGGERGRTRWTRGGRNCTRCLNPFEIGARVQTGRPRKAQLDRRVVDLPRRWHSRGGSTVIRTAALILGSAKMRDRLSPTMIDGAADLLLYLGRLAQRALAVSRLGRYLAGEPPPRSSVLAWCDIDAKQPAPSNKPSAPRVRCVTSQKTRRIEGDVQFIRRVLKQEGDRDPVRGQPGLVE
jgi:hypothetical protein